MLKNNDQLQFIPPYCPNHLCLFHCGTNEVFYVKNGWTKTTKFPFVNQRYKCRKCKIQFSFNTFDLDFRKREVHLCEKVLHFSMHGMSNNSIAGNLNISEGTVRNRLKTMARQSLIFEKEHKPKRLNENVAYDGFETFTYSQFDPCYINTAVGRKSHFIYHNTFSPLNRKGRMTDDQKKKNQGLIEKFGLYPRDSVYAESVYILSELAKIGDGKTVFSDEHKSYRRAYRSLSTNLFYETISSKARRDPSNPLFPINHLHMIYRHFLSSQKRETIAFQKHEAALLEKVQLVKIYRNFMRPKFVKKCSHDQHAHEWSPAMYVGVSEKVLSFRDIFGVRKLPGQVKLDQKEIQFMKRIYTFSRRKISP